MSRSTQIILILFNIAMLFVLAFVRQKGQITFIELQELNALERSEQQKYNKHMVDYLSLLSQVPDRAIHQGFQLPMYEQIWRIKDE